MNHHQKDQQELEAQVLTAVQDLEAPSTLKQPFAESIAWQISAFRKRYATAESMSPETPSDAKRRVAQFVAAAQKLSRLHAELSTAEKRLLSLSCRSFTAQGWPTSFRSPEHPELECRGGELEYLDRISQHIEDFLAPFQGRGGVDSVSSHWLKQRYDRDFLAGLALYFREVLNLDPTVYRDGPFLRVARVCIDLIEPGRSSNLYDKAREALSAEYRPTIQIFIRREGEQSDGPTTGRSS